MESVKADGQKMDFGCELRAGVGRRSSPPSTARRNRFERRGPEIKRHVVAAQAAIEFDSKTGTITVGLPGDGARLSLEQDMLEPQDRPLPDMQNRIQQELIEIGDGY
jgi:hypothetical protein